MRIKVKHTSAYLKFFGERIGDTGNWECQKQRGSGFKKATVLESSPNKIDNLDVYWFAE